MRRRTQDGAVSVMVIGFFLVAAMLTVVVVNATDAYLARQDLNQLADGAALAAADGLRERVVYEQGLGTDAPLDPAEARRLVSSYLAGAGVRSVQVTRTADGIRVRLARVERLAFTIPGMPARTTIRSEAHASLRLAD